jgi:hypothetical protein
LGVFARPQEKVAAFLVLAGLVIAAAFGWSPWSLVALLVAAGILGLVHWRLAGTGVSLWQGLCLAAAWNPTGAAIIGLLIAAPRLLWVTGYALIVVLVGLPLPPAWTRWAWLARLRTEPAARSERR